MGKSSRPKSEHYDDRSFFREHLRRTAIELYDWHLMLHHFWLSRATHYRIKQVSGTPDEGGVIHLCEECHKASLASGNYVCEKIIHDPKKDSFPPKYDDFLQETYKKTCDEEFQQESMNFLREVLKEGKKPYFPDDAEKEYAIMYLEGNHESREAVPIDNMSSFHILSIEARCLSVIYHNFFEYKKITNLPDCDLIFFLDHLKDEVIGDAHELIGYWKLTDERKKIKASWSAKGGSYPKKITEISDAINRVMQDRPDIAKAWDLWTHLRVNADKYDLVYEHDHTGCAQHRLGDGHSEGIVYGTFRGYVTDAKKITQLKKLRSK